ATSYSSSGTRYSLIFRYSVRSPIPSIWAARRRLPRVCLSVASMAARSTSAIVAPGRMVTTFGGGSLSRGSMAPALTPFPAPFPDVPWQVARLDLVIGRQHDHALHEIPQLAHVPRPRIIHQQLHRFGRDAAEWAVVQLRVVLDEPPHENGHVLRPLAQRRQVD